MCSSDLVLSRMDHYKSEHQTLLKEAMTLLELALWKAKLLNEAFSVESVGMSAVEVIAICKEASMEYLREIDFATTNLAEPPSLRYKHFKRAVNKMKGRGR